MNYLDIKNIEHDLASQIKTWAKEFGFSSVGITFDSGAKKFDQTTI